VKVLFDTNIILDILLNRKPFIALSANLVSLVETNKIEGYLCATTVTTIDYLVSKAHNRKVAKISIQKLLSMFEIAQVNKHVLQLSSESKFDDFEDAVQYYSGQLVGVDSIVTRNIKDYKKAEYPIYSPSELWGIIELNQ
jgi:predicted nucleic acid-binding protein